MSEREITRAEQERYDLETLARYERLMARFENHSWGQLGHVRRFRILAKAATADLPILLDKEGY